MTATKNTKRRPTSDLEYYLEKSFITALRAVFMEEVEYTYNNDDNETDIIITSAYPNIDVDFKIPQIVLTDSNFSLSQTSLYNNFDSDIIEKDSNGFDRVVGKKYSTPVPYSVNITCFAQEHGIAKDLANRVFNIISFDARDLFNDFMHLNITTVNKGGTGVYKTKPNMTYSSSVSLQGTIYWVAEKRPMMPDFIKNIKVLMKTSFNEADFNEPFDEEDYEEIYSSETKKEENE